MTDKKGHFSDFLDDFEKEIPVSVSKKIARKLCIAAVLDDILKEKGWNKTRFASETKQQPSVITKWLSGNHNFTVDSLEEIGVTLDVDMFLRISQFESKNSGEWIVISKAVASTVGVSYDINSACMQLTLSLIGKSTINSKSTHYKEQELLS